MYWSLKWWISIDAALLVLFYGAVVFACSDWLCPYFGKSHPAIKIVLFPSYRCSKGWRLYHCDNFFTCQAHHQVLCENQIEMYEFLCFVNWLGFRSIFTLTPKYWIKTKMSSNSWREKSWREKNEDENRPFSMYSTITPIGWLLTFLILKGAAPALVQHE